MHSDAAYLITMGNQSLLHLLTCLLSWLPAIPPRFAGCCLLWQYCTILILIYDEFTVSCYRNLLSVGGVWLALCWHLRTTWHSYEYPFYSEHGLFSKFRPPWKGHASNYRSRLCRNGAKRRTIQQRWKQHRWEIDDTQWEKRACENSMRCTHLCSCC